MNPPVLRHRYLKTKWKIGFLKHGISQNGPYNERKQTKMSHNDPQWAEITCKTENFNFLAHYDYFG